MKLALFSLALFVLNWTITKTTNFNPFYCWGIKPISDMLIVGGMGLFAYGLWFNRVAVLPGLAVVASSTELALTLSGGGSCGQ